MILTKSSHLKLELAMGQSQRVPESAAAADETETDYMTEEEIRDLERRNLLAVLDASNWGICGEDGAASKLGIKPSTFSYRMNAFGIQTRTAVSKGYRLAISFWVVWLHRGKLH